MEIVKRWRCESEDVCHLTVDTTAWLIWLQLSHTMLLCQDSLGDELGDEVVQLPCLR